MNFIRKISKILIFGFVCLIGIGIYYNGFNGILLKLWNVITVYFRDADTWNLIFGALFFAVIVVVFSFSDILWGSIFKMLANKWPRFFQFLIKPWFKSTVQKLVSFTFIIGIFIVGCNILILVKSTPKLLTIENNTPKLVVDTTTIKTPYNVLLLGTSKYLQSGPGKGKENKYYTYRIDAVKQLFNTGMVKSVIISGDHSGEHYSETRDMTNDLLSIGVPKEKIKTDTAGFRTLDSMIRLRQLFHIRDVIIVSQHFHVPRALFQAAYIGMNALGYEAKGSSTNFMVIREFGSKPKVILDLIFFNMQPRVKLSENDKKIHEDFNVTSDKHVILVIAVAFAVFCSMGIVFKYFD